MTGHVYVSRLLTDRAMAALDELGHPLVVGEERPPTREELLRDVAGAVAVVCTLTDPVDADVLDAAGRQLRIVANVAVGYDNIDVPACTRHGVVATNTPGVLVDATADIAMALILMSTRRLGEAERMVREGGTWSWNMFFMLGTGLQGKTLGIVGLGQIGAATARRARAFGMRIAYAGRRRADAGLESELGAEMRDLDDLLATADVVSIHTPLSDVTRHLIDPRRLALMKPTAHLVNTSRGPVVDEAALAAALRDGTIAGAGLDVFEHEPEIHPGLRGLENVVLIPHLGSATIETRTAMGVLAAQNAVAVLRGDPPPTPIA
jgi:glyoxylate reductase